LIESELEISKAQAAAQAFQQLKPKPQALLSRQKGPGLAWLEGAGLGQLRASSLSLHITSQLQWFNIIGHDHCFMLPLHCYQYNYCRLYMQPGMAGQGGSMNISPGFV